MLAKIPLKRIGFVFSLLAILAACAVPLQSVLQDNAQQALEQSAAAATPAMVSLRLTQAQTAEPTPVPVIATATALPATAAPAIEPTPVAPEAGVLMSLWNHSDGRNSLVLVDPYTGRPLPGYAPIDLGSYQSIAAPDGQTLAVLHFSSNNFGPCSSPRAGELTLIDLGQWSERQTGVKVERWVHEEAAAFSPDGGWLALGYSNPIATQRKTEHWLMVVDLATGQTTRAALDFSARRVAYSPDGETLLLYGASWKGCDSVNEVSHAAVLDAGDLSVLWQTDLPEMRDGIYAPESDRPVYENPGAYWLYPAVVFAHDRSALYIVHADADRLTTVDFMQRETRTVEIEPPRSWLDRLLALTAGVAHAKVAVGSSKEAVLSADGKTLYVVGSSSTPAEDSQGQVTVTQTPLELRVVDVAAGTELARAATRATRIQLAPDGEHLFLSSWLDGRNWTEVWDAQALGVVRRLDNKDIVAARRLDGEPMLLSIDLNRMVFAPLEPGSYAEGAEWFLRGYASGWPIATP